MDYCCSTLKGSTHLPKLSGGDGGLRNGDEGFLRGDKVRGSLNGSVWVNHLQKSFSFKKQASKITKPGVAFSVITSDNGKETLVETLAAPRFERMRVNPKNVAAIILGDGAGTQLFPLTSKTATPAVPVGGCYRLIDIPMSNCINSSINKIFVLTQFNSVSLNRMWAKDLKWGVVFFSQASDFGLLKFDNKGQVIQFAEKPKGKDLQAMRVDTTLLGLSPKDAKDAEDCK